MFATSSSSYHSQAQRIDVRLQCSHVLLKVSFQFIIPNHRILKLKETFIIAMKTVCLVQMTSLISENRNQNPGLLVPILPLAASVHSVFTLDYA